MDAGLQPFIPEKKIDAKIRTQLQNRLSQRIAGEDTQLGLVKFMNESTDDYAFERPSRVPAIKITQAMIFFVTRLFSNLYSQASNK